MIVLFAKALSRLPKAVLTCTMPHAGPNTLLTLFVLFSNPLFAQQGQPQEVRVGVLSFGTVNWEIDTIKHHGLDAKRNINVIPVKLTSKNAASIALQSNAVDVILTDLFWVIKQQGKFQFAPTHRLSGGVYATAEKAKSQDAYQSIKRLGVAGGANDKNLLVLTAFAAAKGLPLPKQIQYAAPPLLNEMLIQSRLDGAINFWHYNARLDANGFVNILPTQTMLRDLGIEVDIPLLGWVFSRQYAKQSAVPLNHFLQASQEAKAMLIGSKSDWERLRPKMRAENDEEFAALVSHYPVTLMQEPSRESTQIIRAARQLFSLVKNIPNQTLFTQQAVFPEQIFYSYQASPLASSR